MGPGRLLINAGVMHQQRLDQGLSLIRSSAAVAFLGDGKRVFPSSLGSDGKAFYVTSH